MENLQRTRETTAREEVGKLGRWPRRGQPLPAALLSHECVRQPLAQARGFGEWVSVMGGGEGLFEMTGLGQDGEAGCGVM